MTSKISFSKISIENLRHRTAFILITIFIYLMQLLGFVMQIQNIYAYDLQPKELVYSIQELSFPDHISVIFAMIAGLYLAFDALRALHSKKQSDLYGSLPVRRETEYQMLLLNSFLILFVPAVICTCLKIIIFGVIGQLSVLIIRNVILTLLISLLAFLASWVTAALAVILTGHSFVGLLGYGVFVSYMPLVIGFLIPSYASRFFKTCDGMEMYTQFSKVLNCFSPASLSLKLTDQSGTWKFGQHAVSIVGIILWIVVIGLISYILYRKRPAEAAGRAMSFEKANPVIRFLIVIPMALYTGLFLHEMSFNSSGIWLFVGIIGGAAVFHSIVECIYQFDIHGVLSRKKQLAASIVICLAFTAVFMTDLFGYDKWIPKRDQVASMDITFAGIDPGTDQYWGQMPDGITGETLDTALELIEDATANVRQEHTDTFAGGILGTSATEVSDISTTTIDVTYNMKNGKEKKRHYTINTDTQAGLIDQIYATEDFKNDSFALYTADRSKIHKIEWDNALEYDTLKLTKEEQDEFIDTYLKELTALTYSDMMTMGACSTFSVIHSETFHPYLGGTSEQTNDDYYIYPTFTETIAFLEERGYLANPIMDYRISKLELTVTDENYKNEATYNITDADVIDRYKKELIPVTYNGYQTGYNDHYSITAYFSTANGIVTLDLKVSGKTGEKLLGEVK